MKEKELKRLLRKIRKIQDFLNDEGILSTNDIVGSLGEYFACRRLRLTSASNKNNPSWDALDKRKMKYQIKTRQAHDRNPTPHLYKVTKFDYDYIVLVRLDKNFLVEYMWKLPIKVLKKKKLVSQSGSLNSKKIPQKYLIK